MATAIATTAAVVSALAVPLLIAQPASAVSTDTPNLPVTVTATSPTTGLVNGSNVTFHVDAQAPPNAVASAIFGVDARICQFGSDVRVAGDFNPSGGGLCAMAPLSAGTNNFVSVATAPPNATADLTFKVGTGTGVLDGSNPTLDTSFVCGFANPCTIWLKMFVPASGALPAGLAFKHFDVSFAGAPAAPARPTATTGLTSATLNIVPPASNGSPITGYQVVAPPAGSTATCTTSPAQCVVTGLTSFQTYNLAVTATNAVGTSPASPTVAVIPGPTGPTNVGAQAGPGKVTVTWNAASGSPTGYTASAVLLGTTTPTGTPCTTVALTCDITGLANGVPVQVIVTATYVGGSIPTAPYPAGGVTPVSNNGAITQTFTVNVPAGALTIGQACAFTASGSPGPGGTPGPYGDKPFLGAPQPQNCNIALSAPALNANASGYTSGGTTKEVTVRDLRSGDSGWHVTTALSTSFTNGASVIPSCNFGFLPVVAGLGTLAPYTQSYGLSEQVAPSCNAAHVGAYSASHASATGSAGHGLGDTTINGPVTLDIPLTSAPGTYTGVMTYTLFPTP